ncbi:unnamed protein product [Acanthoscelides obtectus]|uniref:CCHC-type domain-containing protein n=1 Tax=Acanthoscelides obtectus TaxID=200917 RepID=A0A9P0VTE2_ACAOB|nr:unnamed protein product [Acanthoscelides obtectus]CAK1689522.1 hypothetical protein AOBTE_LOCUS37324 [Acanthoscelides obtectus]
MDQRVIRGLPREMSVNDIKEDLESQGIADAVVQQLTSRTTKKPLPLFLVKTKMPEKLAEIQRLAMLTVSFERKKKSSEPSQCYRCQRYGHTQRNCRLAERMNEMRPHRPGSPLSFLAAGGFDGVVRSSFRVPMRSNLAPLVVEVRPSVSLQTFLLLSKRKLNRFEGLCGSSDKVLIGWKIFTKVY